MVRAPLSCPSRTNTLCLVTSERLSTRASACRRSARALHATPFPCTAIWRRGDLPGRDRAPVDRVEGPADLERRSRQTTPTRFHYSPDNWFKSSPGAPNREPVAEDKPTPSSEASAEEAQGLVAARFEYTLPITTIGEVGAPIAWVRSTKQRRGVASIEAQSNRA